MPLGYLFGLAALLLARPSPRSLVLGLLLAVAGETIRIWASGHIEKTARLATGGPYAHTRNPLYLGSALLGAALAVAASSPWVALCVLIYFGAFYPAAIRGEAVFLAGKFGAEYEAWRAAVPAFLPRATGGGPRATRFAWSRVARNREWRTALGVPALFLLLWARAALVS